MLLSERFNRSVIRIGEVTLTHHIMSAWDPCFVFRLNRFTTDTHCFCKSPTLGNSEITKLLHNGTAHLPGIIISRQPHHFTLGELRRMHTGSREPPRPLSDNPNAHSPGKLICEKNVRDVWCRNESVRAEIGQILHTRKSVLPFSKHRGILNYCFS